jgi:hypothetical protein
MNPAPAETASLADFIDVMTVAVGTYPAKYMDALQPRNPLEFGLIEEIAAAKWKQRRAWALETSALDLEIERQRGDMDRAWTAVSEQERNALAFEMNIEGRSSVIALAGRPRPIPWRGQKKY